MRTSTNPIALGIAVTISLLIGVFIATWSQNETAAQDQGAVQPTTEALDLGQLEEELLQKNLEIDSLLAAVDALKAQLASTASARAEVVPGEPPATEQEEASRASTGTESAALSRELEHLRGLLPEKYADLSLDELEMVTDMDLEGEGITDEALLALASLTHLRNLSLRGSHITDAGLTHLGNQLEELGLRGTGVTGLGLANLQTTNLTALHLCDTHITGDDLYRLPPMPNLRTLKLNFLELDDRAIETIGNYPSVRHLELDQTQITDTGLRRLLSLNPNLERIELRGTQVSAEAAEALLEQYPGCALIMG